MFNVADISITAGALLLAWAILTGPKRPGESPPPETPADDGSGLPMGDSFVKEVEAGGVRLDVWLTGFPRSPLAPSPRSSSRGQGQGQRGASRQGRRRNCGPAIASR